MSEPLDRRSVAEALNRLSFAAELLDDDRVDAKACSSLAWTIRQLDGDVDVDRIATLDGVSVPILAVIDDVAHERVPPLLRELESLVPQGLLEIRRLKGLGPKKIRSLWQDLDITSVGELEYACKENRLVTLKGFGKKTQDAVLEQIAALRERAGLMRLDHAEAMAELLVAALAAAGKDVVTHAAGELRRRTEVVAEIALVTSLPAAQVAAALSALQSKLAPPSAATGAASSGGAAGAGGDDESSAPAPVEGAGARAPATADFAATLEDALRDGSGSGALVRARLRGTAVVVRAGVDAAHMGTALVLATGSAAHVDKLRARALDKGLVLDTLACAGEAEVYDRLGLVVSEPEQREENAPLIEKGKVRRALVALGDLQGSLHNHTTASDGDASMREMRDAAAALGMRYLAITDHSQSAVYARGLGVSALDAQKKEARALNDEHGAACVILCGVESDILKDGALDYADDVLGALDIVVASVHARFGQKGPDLTARMLAAARNDKTDIVGHPTGRLLLGRAPSEYDVSAFLAACADTGVAVELNANPARLDLNERHLAEAKERGVLVSIAADAHAVDELPNVHYGVSIARRAGLSPADVLNARPVDEVRGWLKARREKARARARAIPASDSAAE